MEPDGTMNEGAAAAAGHPRPGGLFLFSLLASLTSHLHNLLLPLVLAGETMIRILADLHRAAALAALPSQPAPFCGHDPKL